MGCSKNVVGKRDPLYCSGLLARTMRAVGVLCSGVGSSIRQVALGLLQHDPCRTAVVFIQAPRHRAKMKCSEPKRPEPASSYSLGRYTRVYMPNLFDTHGGNVWLPIRSIICRYRPSPSTFAYVRQAGVERGGGILVCARKLVTRCNGWIQQRQRRGRRHSGSSGSRAERSTSCVR